METCSLHVGNVFPIRWERVPGKLGIKFHLAENEWHSYVTDNKHLAGIFRPPAFIRLFFSGPFPFVRFRLPVCAVSAVVFFGVVVGF
ncbi:hypothetical protein [uncultured Bacteroides sp.]|uniref:hypothetical protein n=1 Tax=uncultured Bacteroides sp. TaxID=162156 RepID=UPI00261B82A0|nr:hypothetical protein [uncultured Bacteroides sp.]